MRKGIVVALCAGLIAGSFAAPAQSAPKKKKKPKKVERVIEFQYECPCTGFIQLGSLTGGDPNLGGGAFPIGAGEVFISGEVKDTTGQPIWVSINQDTNGDGFNDEVATFCGKSDAPLPINEGLEIRVFVGNVGPSCPGPGLGGTITFTLSNMP